MVDPVTITAALGVVGGIGKMFGGITASAQAKEQAAFFSEVYDEQIAVNNLLFNRQIRGELGEDITNIAARGVAQTGSPIESAIEEAFSKQLAREAKNQQLRFQQLQQEIQGKQSSQEALLGGIGGVVPIVGGLAEGIELRSKQKEAEGLTGSTTGDT